MKFSSLAVSTALSFAVLFSNPFSPTSVRVCVCAAEESHDLFLDSTSSSTSSGDGHPFLDDTTDNEDPLSSIGDLGSRGLEVDIFEDLRDSHDEIYGGGSDEGADSKKETADGSGGGGGTSTWQPPDQEAITEAIVKEIKMELTGNSPNDDYTVESAIMNAIKKLLAGATEEQMKTVDDAWFQKHIYVS